LKEGEYIEYSPSFNLDNYYISHKCNYHNDKLDGEYIEYYENGNIKIKTYYYYNKLHGEYIEYYENGNIYLKTNYIYGKIELQNNSCIIL
jgi:antitoxin component YwqK of YwqJK toxin-antitoxin module